MNLIFKTLAISTLALAAFGADKKLYFNVEFPFYAGSAVMPSGAYSIGGQTSNNSVYQLVNRQTGRGVFLSMPAFNQLKFTDEAAALEFRCGLKGCALSTVKNLLPGYSSGMPRSKEPGLRTFAVALTSTALSGK